MAIEHSLYSTSQVGEAQGVCSFMNVVLKTYLLYNSKSIIVCLSGSDHFN